MPTASRPQIAGAMLTLTLALFPASALAAWPNDPTVNVPICTAAETQVFPSIASDGNGGAIITWQDDRNGYGSNIYDIYAQHVLAGGQVDPAWPVDGRSICTAVNSQYSPTIASDGSGGAIIAWYDNRSGTDTHIYAQHVLAGGTVDPVWPADGRALCTAANSQRSPVIVSDGSSGAIVAWTDCRSDNGDIYAQRVLAGGQVDPAWPVDGRAISTAPQGQDLPMIVSDGAGGAIVTWTDFHSSYHAYAQHVFASGNIDPAWPAGGRALTNTGYYRVTTAMVTDGAGGAIVSWHEDHSGNYTNYDVYAQHVLASGVVDPTWTAAGRAICSAASNQTGSSMVSDGLGGAIIAWSDQRDSAESDIFAQHVQTGGFIDARWPVDGRALCTVAGYQDSPTLVADGSGGAIVAWTDRRSGVNTPHIYAQHILNAGSIDPACPANGIAVFVAPSGSYTSTHATISDGAGGAIVTWNDARSGGYPDIYAQRVAPFGRLGSPEPQITGVCDVPGDQGGKVRIAWNASYLDTLPTLEIAAYGIWRQVSQDVALAGQRRGARLLAGPVSAADAQPGVYRKTAGQASAAYWEGVGAVLARAYPTYTFVAPTLQDSMPGSNPNTIFMVDAHAAFVPGFWDSAPDSGHSVDNLAPTAPTRLAGMYTGGATHLHWAPNAERDLGGYRIYRATVADFTPGPGNLAGSTTDTCFADGGMPGSYYRLSAVDVHGNESPFAFLTPSNTTGVGAGDVPRALALGAPAPNPLREVTTLHFSLPHEGRVALAVFDLQGRQVRELVRGAFPGGERSVTWNGRDDQGRSVSSGIYFVRLEALGRTLVRRVAMVR